MEESWENWHLHMEMDCENDFLGKCHGADDDEFLRDIFQRSPAAFSSESESDHSFHASSTFQNNSIPTAADGAVLSPRNLVKSNSSNSTVSQNGSKRPRRLSSPRTYILSFDNSTMIPATPEPCPRSCNNSPLPAKRALESPGPEPTTRPSQEAKKVRTSSQTIDHIMAERRRRQELTERFIALSATIPGLNKTDKASVLRAAIDYVKQLQERVQELEQEDKKRRVESVIFLKNPDPNGNEDTTSTETNCSILPEMEARVLGKEVLIEIHCEKENGIELKILDHIENLHLKVTGSSVLPFGNSALCITITAQMGDAYQMAVNDLVKDLRQVLSKSHVLCDSDPY
ncbi:Transcription factor bHLH25 [Spatholobus suberectus]|nr:Transcription factor bHLH25 [Spatholobus suberectus]